MKKLVLLTAFMVPFLKATAKAESVESVEVNKTAQGVDFTQSIDLAPWSRVSAQAVYTDGTPSSFSFTGGSLSSATITVSTGTPLIGAQASVLVNIVSTTGVLTDTLTLNGVQFTEGTHWRVTGTTITSAAVLAAVINGHPDYEATSLGSTITVKYATYGISGNGLAATTTDATNLKLSSPTFQGGRTRNTITINGTVLTEGTDFNAQSSSITTAINISTNINANTTLNTQVVASTSSNGVVLVSALTTGFKNYNISSSTPALLTNGGFPGGNPSDVDLQTDVFTKTSHGLTTGLRVLITATAGNMPSNLVTNTTYFAIKLTENTYKLATSSTNAVAGTAIDISTVSNNATMDIKPLALVTAAGNGFFFSVSNDNTNFTTLTGVTVNGVSVSSVTYSAAGNSVWDFGTMAYRYLRVNFKAPTSGGIGLVLRLFGRKD